MAWQISNTKPTDKRLAGRPDISRNRIYIQNLGRSRQDMTPNIWKITVRIIKHEGDVGPVRPSESLSDLQYTVAPRLDDLTH